MRKRSISPRAVPTQSSPQALSRKQRRSLAAPWIAENLERRLLLTTIMSNPVTGNWNQPSTWAAGVIPNNSDNVIIVAGAHITVTDNESANSLQTLAGSDLSLSGTLTFTLFDANPGDASTIAGSLEVGVNSGFTNSGSSPIILAAATTLAGAVEGTGMFDNTGTLILPGGGVYGAKLLNDGTANITAGMLLGGGGTFTNNADGTVNLTNDGGFLPTTFPGLEGGTFINMGTFNKTGGTGTSNFPDYTPDETFNASAFQNLGGTININAGTLAIKGHANLAGGTINVAANSTFAFDDPNKNSTIGLTGTITGSGPGSIAFDTGVYNLALPNGLGAAGTLNFPAGLATLGTIEIDSYDGLILANTGFLNFDSAATTGPLWLDNSGTIQNTGAGDLQLVSLTNEASGLVDLKSSAGLLSGTVNIAQNLLNMGTLRKSAGPGTSNVTASLTNAGGTIDVESGTLNLDAITNIIYQGGATHVATGSILDLDPASAVVVGGTWTSTGSGIIQLTGGYLRGRNNTTGPEGAQPGVLNFAPNTFFVTGGFFNTSNEGVTNAGTINITTAVSVGSFTNTGTVLLNGSQFFFNGIITNTPSGVIDFSSDATIGMNGYLINNGTIIKTAGTGTIDLSSFGASALFDGTDRFKNNGTLESVAGTLILPSDVFTIGSDGKLDVPANSSLITDAAGSITLAPSWDVTPVTITTIDGNVTLGGPGSPIPALAPLAKVNGTLTLNAGSAFATAGQLAVTGTLVVGGHLTVNGNLTESGANATLDFAVSSAPSASGAPLLTVTGNTTLTGNLTAHVTGGFAASTGLTYPVATFASPPTGAFASTAGVAPDFSATVNATSITLLTAGTTGSPDLAVTSVTGPAGAAPGSGITLRFVVTNQGNASASGTWFDSVFLTKNGTIDNNSILLGGFEDGQPLAPGASYDELIPTFLPLTTAGNYTIVVETDSRQEISDPNRANNIALSAPFPVSFPSLALGQAATDFINNGQDKIYRLTLPTGADVSLNPTFDVGTAADVYVSYGVIPTTTTFDESYIATSATSGSLIIPVHQAGDYYILVHGREGANGNSTFTLTPTPIAFGAQSITPGHSVDAGPLTATITGSGFTPATTVALVSGATTITPQALQFINANTLSASFYMDFPPPGNYNLVVANGAASATLPNAFNINAGYNDGGNLTYNLVLPSASRGDLNGVAYLEYSNTGFIDIPAPYFAIIEPNTEFKLAGQSDFSDGEIEALGIAPNGLPGTLAPGQGGVIPITYRQIDVVSHQNVQFQIVALDTLPGFDLSSLKAALQPANEPNDAWNAIWSNFTAIANANPDGFTGVLRDAANALSVRGIRTSDVSTLLNYAVQAAGDYGAITQRYEVTAFGRGQTNPYAQFASADANGNVIISAGGAERIFLKQTNGTYLSASDDGAQLSRAAGIYTLRDTSGETTVFNPDGSLNYFHDIDGNRLTAGYTAGLMTSLTASDGDTYAFTYNTAGFIDQVIDPVGRITTYTYDPTTSQLLSITSPQGTTHFTYYSGPNLAELYAITSIIYPDGTSRDYTYDSLGRLTSQSRGDGSQAISYTYVAKMGIFTPSGYSAVIATDALGNTTSETVADGQGVASLTDALGNVASIAYDPDGRPTSATTPGGFTSATSYDANGNISTVRDALGAFTAFSYDASSNLLQLTDANGNASHFTYDANGNLTGITDPAGNISSFAYNTAGDPTGSASAAGRTVAIAYNAFHLATSRTYADGSTVTYTYDAHRNLLAAADSLNGTTTYTYDSADRLTSVTSPNGLSLTYAYNAGGQLIQKSDQTGFVTNYAYNAAGQLTQLTNSAGAALVTYTYDAAGNLTHIMNLNGTSTTYAYNPNGQVTTVTNTASGGGVLSQFTYTYNANGQQATVTTSGGTTTYTYDADRQLIQAVLPGGRTITYAYDAVGNRTTVSDTAVASLTYSTNNLDEYVTVGNTTYTYDRDGNLLASTGPGGTTTYTYNDRGQLASESAPGHTYAFQYDALGNRVAVTDNGLTTRYLIDPTGISTIDGTFDAAGNVISHYLYGVGLAGAVAANGAASFYAFDASGNTADITNSAGSVTSTFSYLPFGQILSSTGGSNLFTFAGQFGVLTSSDGTYFMRMRSYSPSLGRFLEKDPSSYLGGDVNLYRYSTNDPINNADPTGRDGFILGAAGAGLRTLTSALVNPTGLGTNALFNLVRTGGISALTPVAEAGTETAVSTTAVTLARSAASQVVSITIENGVFTIPSAAPVVTGAVAIPAAPVALAAAVVLAPLGKTVADNYFRTHYPDGFPVPVERAINQNTFNKILQKPTLQSLIDDFVKEFGRQPDQNQLIRLMQYANAVDNNTVDQFVRAHSVNDDNTQYINAHDPNDIVGPAGFGPAGFVTAAQSFPYEITFENEATASAPAKVVTITQQLDAHLDWTTFQLAAMGFGSHTLAIPAGLTSYATSVLLSDSLRVDISAVFNVLTGLLTWTFTSIDPATGDLPADALAGFLPPDDAAGDGFGFITYLVKPQASLATGAQIHALATITFDGNLPINTPNILNTIDAVSPASAVTALPATQSSTNFPVTWTGGDDPSGSGIASTQILVSVDGAAFTLWMTAPAANGSATFSGSPGHTYAFESIATDGAGNTGALPFAAQAATAVPAVDHTLTVDARHPAKYRDAAGNLVTVTLAGPGTATLSFLAASNAGPVSFTVADTTAKTRITVSSAKVTTLSNVQITGSLAAFTAPKSDLVGNFTITGSFGALTLNNVAALPATIQVQGAALPTTYKFATLHDVAITSAAPIKSLTAAQWTNTTSTSDALTAPSIATLHVTGNFDADLNLSSAGLALGAFSAGAITAGTWTIAGSAKSITTAAIAAPLTASFAGSISSLTVRGTASGSLTAKSINTLTVQGNLSNATLRLTGGPDLGKTPALNTLTVNGALANSQIRSVGNIRSITLGGASDSLVFAGISDATTTLPASSADFIASSSISTFTVRGKSAFANTFVAAAAIGAASLTNVTTANNGAPFGVAAKSLQLFILAQPKQKTFRWTTKQSPSILATLPGDLRAVIVA